MRDMPGSRGIFGRRHLPEMRVSTLVDWNELLPDEWVRHRNKTELLWELKNGSVVWARPMADAAAIGKGPTLGWAGLDEATDIPRESRRKLISRLRQPETERRLFEVTNPDGPDHPIFLEYGSPPSPPALDLERALRVAEAGDRAQLNEIAASLATHHVHGDHEYFSATSLENSYLDTDYFVQLLRSHSGKDAQRFVTGGWTDPEGRIWPTFGEHNLCDPFEIPKSWERHVAIDFGWSHDNVTLWIAWDPESHPIKRCVVYKSSFDTALLTEEMARQIFDEGCRDRMPDTVWCDWDLRSRNELQHELARLGVTREMRRARKDRVAGQRCLNGAFMPKEDGHPSVFVFRTERKLISQVVNYRRPPPESAASKKDGACVEFVDGESVVDGCDALRYGVYSVLGGTFRREVGYDPGMSSNDRWHQMRRMRS